MKFVKPRIAIRLLVAGLFLLPIYGAPYSAAQKNISQSAKDSQDQDAHPAVAKVDLKIAKRAEALLGSESSWERADRPHITDDPTTECQPDAKQLSLYCALERATIEVSGKFEHRGAVMQEARFAIEDREPDWENKYHHILVDYNNDPHTTFQDIQSVLQSVKQRISSRLKQKK